MLKHSLTELLASVYTLSLVLLEFNMWSYCVCARADKVIFVFASDARPGSVSDGSGLGAPVTTSAGPSVPLLVPVLSWRWHCGGHGGHPPVLWRWYFCLNTFLICYVRPLKSQGCVLLPSPHSLNLSLAQAVRIKGSCNTFFKTKARWLFWHKLRKTLVIWIWLRKLVRTMTKY